jgi:hypothetical protein
MKLVTALLLTLPLQQCSFLDKSAESARVQTEQGLHEYFPHAKAVMLGNLLLGVTCADLSQSVTKLMPAMLEQNPNVGKLKTYGPILNIRSFALGFPDHALVLDLQTKQYQILPAASLPDYDRIYSTSCPGPSPRPTLATAPLGSLAQLYIGTFRATISRPNNPDVSGNVTDSLGIYKAEDFARSKDREVAVRMDIIREDFAYRGFTLTGLELVSVKAVPIPE